MDGFRKASPFASMAGGGYGSDPSVKSSNQSNFRAGEQQNSVVFGSGSGGGFWAAAKRGRERPRSQSPNARPPRFIANTDAMKAMGKAETEQQRSDEEAAKARRLLRFRAELGPAAVDDEGTGSAVGSRATTPDVVGHRKPSPPRPKYPDNGFAVRAETNAEHIMETDAPDNVQWTSEPILGVCPDMCPETERDERERKGDLDRFERVGGNRNQTTRDLAVKKYTRTPEKDAVLIRPLSVLKDTMRHLLSLLERGHEDGLLRIHGFLWDRMRAVRMDLRMQHIFTEEAIVMHEQMIRFHILAMHELCELSPEEGITDVFNAHLNIEQMNKASVDLFQMYEDHAKRGIFVQSEPEFRGYYALLKLDKHPGYRVEPAELSLDLAKMTPEIRNSPQVRFARDVARACRTSNYVAFFRLARKATYLQACLMHAHFSKVYTQALASLHSGLQKNQGIPVSTVAQWLGMEGESIQRLILYHGFSVKHYEKAYVVKDGSFMHKDEAFSTSRAGLVKAKRSSRMVMDVMADARQESLTQSVGMVKPAPSNRSFSPGAVSVPNMFPVPDPVDIREEEMPDYMEELGEEELDDTRVGSVAPVLEVKRSADIEPKLRKKRRMEEFHDDAREHESRRIKHEADLAASREEKQAAAVEKERQEALLRRARHTAEANAGKLASWFRKWRRQAAAKALESRQKLIETEEALDALSLGYPLWKKRVIGESLNTSERKSYTDLLVNEQALTLQEMWEPIDVPSVVGPVLQGLNPLAGLIHWKLLLSTLGSQLGQWVRMKLKGKFTGGQNFPRQSTNSIAEETMLLNQGGRVVEFRYTAEDLGPVEAVRGSKVFEGINALLFEVDENKSLSLERARLHALIESLPAGANVPLLILSSKPRIDKVGAGGRLAEEDDLHQLFNIVDLKNSSKISGSRIVSLGNTSRSTAGATGYYREAAIREGLTWLARLSPVQPALRSLHIADLVREHVNTRLRFLLSLPLSDVNPNWCIKVINEGIQNAADEIVGIDSACPALGPWHSERTLESMRAKLESCFLPTFPPLDLKCNADNIMLQKFKLEQGLFEFLSSSISDLASKWEVSKMIQRGCTVHWSESGRKLVPRWGEIFQSIMASRLLLLRTMSLPLVYISRTDTTPLRPYKLKDGNFHSGSATSPVGHEDGQLLLEEVGHEDVQLLLEEVGHEDGQLLLEEVIGERLHGRLSVKESQSASQELCAIPHIPLVPVKEGAGEFCSMGDALHKVSPPMPQSFASTLIDGDALQSTVVVVPNREQAGDTGSLKSLQLRIEKQRSHSLNLAVTESESSLHKMVEDLKHRQSGPVESAEVRKIDERHILQFDSTETDNIGFAEHKSRDGPGREDECATIGNETGEEDDHVLRNNLLVASPFGVLLDKMVAELRTKGCSQQYLSDSGLLSNRIKYQKLQTSKSK